MGHKRERTRTGDRPDDDGDPSTSSFSFPEAMPCSSGVESSQKKDVTDHSGKQHNAHFPPHRHHQQHRQNSGRPIYLKRSRHYYGHQHHWRNPGTYFRSPSSHEKISPWDGKLSFKMASSDNGQYTEERERAFNVPEIIIQSNTVDTNSDLPDPEKMPCGICHRLLKRQSLLAPSAGEHAIVAVLVCGHLYHADCLEHKTPSEEKTDPPCPICLGLSVHADEPVIELD